MSIQETRSEHPAPEQSSAVDALNFGKTKIQKQAMPFFEKLEVASSARTIERLIITRDKFEKLCAFCVETSETSSRQDFYYDFPEPTILSDGMSLRIRVDKDMNGERRVTLKMREKSTEFKLTYVLSEEEIAMWEDTDRKYIPLSALEKCKIRPAYAKTRNVGVICTTRSLLFDGGVTIDNCFFQKGKQTFKDYEVRLKNEECREDLYLLFKNQFLNIPLEQIEESRYQRLMSI